MTSAATKLRRIVRHLLGAEPTVRIRLWDGSELGPTSSLATILVNSPNAIRRILYSPGELGFARAYVAGEIEVEGDIFEALALRDLLTPSKENAKLSISLGALPSLVRAAWSLGAAGLPLPHPAEEAHLSGRRHSKRRDEAAISHHYDVSNDFYRLVLGENLTYSCAYFVQPGVSLDEAQRAKHELVCRKLGLRPGMRLLDVGCGWGGMVLHAAANHSVSAVGITLSQPQADLAAKRAAELGLADRIEIRLQDYRDVSDGPYDAISSIGMYEHVGAEQAGEYFGDLFELLAPKGRLLNHAISRPSGRPRFDRRSFIARYVFPDGELQEVGSVVTAMQENGFEVRDVESLREHYMLTLKAWVANLERNWEQAAKLAGPARARIWRLYMAGSALGFAAGRINIHQVLGVKTDPAGSSGMPPSRASWTIHGELRSPVEPLRGVDGSSLQFRP